MKNVLFLKAQKNEKLGHFRIKKRTKRTRRHVKSYGVVWTNVDRPVWRMQCAWGEPNGAAADFVIENRFSLAQTT